MKNSKWTKKRVIPLIVILGVVIIPLLYSFFYLDAFWDPYAKLSDLPVAIVNLDKGAVIQEENRNLGGEMCDELKGDGSLKFVFTDEQDAREGTEKAKYYATILIPEDFSANIASANTEHKQMSTIIFQSNEKRNFLATQILSKAVDEMEIKTKQKITKEITKELADQLRSAPSKLGELSDGLGKLSDGAETLADKLNDFSAGANKAKQGADQVSDGANSLSTGLEQLLAGATQLNNSVQNMDQLKSGAETLAASANTFNQSLVGYTNGVQQLIGQVGETSAFLQKYATKINPEIQKDPYFSQFLATLNKPENAANLKKLSDATGQLKEGSKLIAKGVNQISAATKNADQLKAGVGAIKEGLTTAKAGSDALAKGSASLKGGLTTLGDGAGKLQNGSEELKNGIDTAKNEVENSITSADTKLTALDGLDEFASSPVEFEKQSINPVPNYGTAFAPYFLSLSFWVGALIIFFGIYFDADGKFKLLSRNSNNKLARSFIYLLIGFVQAMVLGVVLTAGLGLHVEHVFLYYFACSLISVVFIAIVQFLLVFAKDIGKFLAIAFLILQLTSCGGTFPMETVPKLFNVLYPFMPMTYSVGLLKEAISSPNADYAGFNIAVLVGILVVFMLLTVILSLKKKKDQQKQEEEDL